MASVRVRIAPSPTGYFHFGLARTALYNYLFAKKEGGVVVLRLEDTDSKRSSPEYAQDIYDSFEWLGISFDEKYVQSEHVARHTELLHKLVNEDKAYVSEEPAKDDPEKLNAVVRLRNPGRSITFTDVIRGNITFDTTELGDFVIARSINDPLYHFAVVADDGDSNITHIIRGEDHISNTPRQILIQEALGLSRPVYAHLPLILAPDRTKMSKRRHQTALREFRAKGYLPEAMVNFIALLGWSEGAGNKELYTLNELIQVFSLEGIHKSAAVFNEEKLRWFNRQYLLREDENEFADEILDIMKTELEARGITWDHMRARLLVPLIHERISVYGDVRMLASAGEYDYFFIRPQLDPFSIPERNGTVEEASRHLEKVESLLQSIEKSAFDASSIKGALWGYATKHGRGAVLWPLRYSLSGREQSADPFVIASIIGKTETQQRIDAARALL